MLHRCGATPLLLALGSSLLLVSVSCYTSSFPSIRPTRPTVTSLFGVRSRLRETLQSFGRSSFKNDNKFPGASSTEYEETVATLEAHSKESLYSLPPVDRELTKLEKEFRDMLCHFADYSERDLLSLRDPKVRKIFRGVAASAHEPPVYRAFEVLFEDLYPLRVAGRLIYRMLQDKMEQSQHERQKEVDFVVSETGLDPKEVEEARLAFVSVAAELNGDVFLTFPQLTETGLSETAQSVLGFESVDQLLTRLDSRGKGKLNFTELVIGLQDSAEEMCAVERCNPAAVMHKIMSELRDHPPTSHSRLDERKQKFSDRYDFMVSTFSQWEDLVPDGGGRRMDVVRGCFVGAKNKYVVDALRVVYVDYSALRVAGDIIFKLVSSVMRGRQRRVQ